MVFFSFSFFLMIFLNSSITWACAVCGFGEDGSRMSYLITTIILTFVPLTAILTVLYVIKKKVSQTQRK